jgi:hypothetical protein
MPMTFGEAYKIVCPDGCPVVPHSKEHRDIMELMRQSGHLHYTERLVHEAVPVVPTRVDQVRRFTARDTITPAPLKVSKKQWLSVSAHKEAFDKCINKNISVVAKAAKQPKVITERPVPTTTKLSRREWAINNINKNNSP